MDENTSNFGDDKDLPKLSIEQENAFKKMKMSLESNAIFPENFSKMLPPEVESAFLDGIMQFEQLYRNAKRISVFERIGSPKLKNSEEFSDEAVALELKKLISKLKRKGIAFSSKFEYPDRQIYDFLVNELFLKEVDDFQMKGMMLYFSYEDFHPNHAEILKNLTMGYLDMFMTKDSKNYRKKYSKDAKNHKELNTFRDIFEKFEIKELETTTVHFDLIEKKAKVNFQIDFIAKVVGSGLIVRYAGNGYITFIKKTNTWKLRKVKLPIEKTDATSEL